MHLGFLLGAAAGKTDALLAVGLVRQHRVVLIALSVMRIDVGAVWIPTVLLLLGVRAVVLLMLMNALMRPTWVLMAVAVADHSACSFLCSLFGVSSVLARSHSRVRSDDLSLHSEQRLVDLDELVDQVVEPLLVIDIGTTLHLKLPVSIAFQILGENLLQVFVEFLGILVF